MPSAVYGSRSGRRVAGCWKRMAARCHSRLLGLRTGSLEFVDAILKKAGTRIKLQRLPTSFRRQPYPGYCRVLRVLFDSSAAEGIFHLANRERAAGRSMRSGRSTAVTNSVCR